jgi:hypothetical protein
MGKSYFYFKDPVPESMPGIPDVYWDGKPEIDLADDPVTGRPRVFGSRGEKARYLKERGIYQVDKSHKLRAPDVPQGTKEESRDKIRQTLAEIKNMGIDYRRQQYLKIVNESRKR